MKKVLFGSTALVAAAFAGQALANGSVQHNDGVTLTVGGYFTAGVATGSYATNAAGSQVTAAVAKAALTTGATDPDKDFVIINDGEIHFTAAGTLDNGIGIKVRVELEAHTDADQMDEHYMEVSTAFGRFMVGGNDNAFENVSGGIGVMGGALGGGSWDSDNLAPGGTGTRPANIIGDDLGVHYYTPNISGFEFGVSWQPDNGTDPATGTYSTFSSTNSEDAIAVGGSYSNTLGAVDFTIGAGYIAFTDNSGDDDTTSVGGGIELGFGAITIGGHGGVIEFDDADTTTGDVETTQFGAGIEYVDGPWIFGLSGFMQEIDHGTANQDWESWVVNANVGMNLADGVNVGLGVEYGEADFDSATLEDEEGWAAELLLGVSF